MKTIDGKKLSEEILAEVKEAVAGLSFQPVFSDVLVGSDPSSVQYVNMKARKAESVGMIFHRANFPESITTEELIEEIKRLNLIPDMCGLIVQLPLPEHIDRQAVLDAIDSRLDVDCLGKSASEKFYHGDWEVGYPTALACLALLDSLDLNLGEKKIAVLGQGMLVGKPVAALLRSRGLQPEVVRSSTKEKEKIISQADIIVSGIGQGGYIKGGMIKRGAVLIDAGTSEADSSIVGDVDLESVREVAGFVSPVPGGVGPVTVAMLLQNVLKVAQNLR